MTSSILWRFSAVNKGQPQSPSVITGCISNYTQLTEIRAMISLGRGAPSRHIERHTTVDGPLRYPGL
jgi:hypothetical protein